MKYRFWLGVSFLICACVGLAGDKTKFFYQPLTDDMRATVQADMRWIAEHSKYSAVVPLPNIAYTSEDVLHSFLRGGSNCYEAQDYIWGVYSSFRRTIYLLSGYDIHEKDTSYQLLHELVHHMQAMHRLRYGKTFPSSSAREREAYTLQNIWIREFGISEKFLAPEKYIARVSACPS